MAERSVSGDDTVILPAGRYLLSLAGASEDAGQTGDLDLNSNITFAAQNQTSDYRW